MREHGLRWLELTSLRERHAPRCLLSVLVSRLEPGLEFLLLIGAGVIGKCRFDLILWAVLSGRHSESIIEICKV